MTRQQASDEASRRVVAELKNGGKIDFLKASLIDPESFLNRYGKESMQGIALLVMFKKEFCKIMAAQ